MKLFIENQFGFDEKFLEALENEKIRQAIRQILSEENPSARQEPISSLPVSSLHKTIASPIEPVIENDSKEVKRLQKELERTNKELQKLQDEKEKSKLSWTEKYTLNQEINQQKRTITNYERQIVQLNDELKKLQQQAALASTVPQLQAQVQSLTVSLQHEQQKSIAASSQLAPFEAAYNDFMSLRSETRHTLRGIFKNDTLTTFIFCGVQEQNLSSLWEAMKREVMNGNTDELRQLNAIFEFCLQASNEMYNEPLYVRNDTKVGTMLDEDTHVRTATSAVRGSIANVLFEGYYNAKTGRIVKKTIVHV